MMERPTSPNSVNEHRRSSQSLYELYFDLLIASAISPASDDDDEEEMDESESCVGSDPILGNNIRKSRPTFTLIGDYAKLPCGSLSVSGDQLHRAMSRTSFRNRLEQKRHHHAKERDVSPPICRWQSDLSSNGSSSNGSGNNSDSRNNDDMGVEMPEEEHNNNSRALVHARRGGLSMQRSSSSRSVNGESNNSRRGNIRPSCPQRKRSNDFDDVRHHHNSPNHRLKFEYRRSMSMNDMDMDARSVGSNDSCDRPSKPQRKHSNEMAAIERSLVNSHAENGGGGSSRRITSQRTLRMPRRKTSKENDNSIAGLLKKQDSQQQLPVRPTRRASIDRDENLRMPVAEIQQQIFNNGSGTKRKKERMFEAVSLQTC